MFSFKHDVDLVDWEEAALVIELASLGRKNPEELSAAFSNSSFSLFLYDSGKLVGTGRVISDNVFQSVICDMAVLPEYQSPNIAEPFVKEILKHVKTPGIILVTSPYTMEFYKKCGFNRLMIAAAGANQLECNSIFAHLI